MRLKQLEMGNIADKVYLFNLVKIAFRQLHANQVITSKKKKLLQCASGYNSLKLIKFGYALLKSHAIISS